MNLWGWVIAYVVGFSLLQVLIYRYLKGRGDGGAGTASGDRAIERTAPPRERWNNEGRSAISDLPQGADPLYASSEVSSDAAATPRGRHCPRCGTLNEPDPTFTYCRECVRPLG